MKPGHPSTIGDYAVYESMKARWVAEHPGASSAEYDAAMRRIAEECGV